MAMAAFTSTFARLELDEVDFCGAFYVLGEKSFKANPFVYSYITVRKKYDE